MRATFPPQGRQYLEEIQMRLRSLCLLAAFATTLWAADPFLGAWKLNLAQSKFKPGPAPRSATMTWSTDPKGTLIRTDGIRADGHPMHESYLAIYDGQEHKTPGPWNFDSVINRRVSDYEREDIFKKRGVIVGRSKLTVSPDGKRLTSTWNYGELRDVRVYDKE
jgi:hypothetical protein